MRYRFLECRYDAEHGLAGPSGRIALRRSDSRLLELLLEADGRIVPKDVLIAGAWGDRDVSEDSLFQATRRLRAAMAGMPGSEVIQTIKGAGLRIGVVVRRSQAAAPGVAPAFAPSDNLQAVAILSSAWERAARRSPRELEAAVAAAARALELNRWGNWFSGLLAQYLFFAGARKAALVEARAAVERFPEVEISHMLLSIVASGVGLHGEAVAAGRRAMELAPDTPLVHTALACALARAGSEEEALQLTRTIEARGIAAHCPWLATAYLAMNRRDAAIDVLERARDTGSPQFVCAFVDPRLAALNRDPAFERLRPARAAAK